MAAVRKMIGSPRYRPRPGAVKPEEAFTCFFYVPDQPDLEPRPPG